MGLNDWLKDHHMRDPVRGTLRVTSASYPPTGVNAIYSNFRLHGVVAAPGLEPAAVQHSGLARLSRWPQPGQDLPVTVDRADPTRLRIEWDEIQSSADQEQQFAEELAQQMRAETTGPVPWDSGRPAPGAPGGGTTPEQAQVMVSRGERASAVVVGAEEMNAPPGLAPPGGIVDVTFQVTTQDGQTYTTRSRMGFSSPQRRNMVAVVGQQVPVRIDRADPSRIAVDTAALGL